MSNHLINETSPYLLQHSENPVDWYPWCEEAFARAKAEDKPVFLSIGYSTCHWCHVMAHESFENKDIAHLLNSYFISIKVDKEERPDIDSIYMSVCQAFTGSGGWPTSIFMTPDQKPFFAGTYFPITARYGSIGFKELLYAIHQKWLNDRALLLSSAEEVLGLLREQPSAGEPNRLLLKKAVEIYKASYDKEYGGFGNAPKFPSPHNLLFLLQQYEKNKNSQCLEMAEHTLVQMYRGGIFDHIGYGFCRYSTDKYYLAPHFEKMLYDNALLMLAYCKACEVTEKAFYREVAEKIAAYLLQEMTSGQGGFYSAQDADSDGEEGKYYLLAPWEICNLLGKETGEEFNRYYDITEQGNFEGKSIPNLLQSDPLNTRFEKYLPAVYEYRKQRNRLHLDDKILTSWNALMIAALCQLYRISKKPKYLQAAKNAQQFINKQLCKKDTLYVSFRNGRKGEKGFLDDYANVIYAQLALYDATLEKDYLQRAEELCQKAIADFYDARQGGFFLYGKEHEQLILQPKETYDGAMPSGNSVMAYNLVRLTALIQDEKLEEILKQQLAYLAAQAQQYSAGYAMFLLALSDYLDAPPQITVVLADKEDKNELPFAIPLSSTVNVLHEPTENYPLKEDKTTFYLCHHQTCMPPTHDLNSLKKPSGLF